jgi:hypothetical protein
MPIDIGKNKVTITPSTKMTSGKPGSEIISKALEQANLSKSPAPEKTTPGQYTNIKGT